MLFSVTTYHFLTIDSKLAIVTASAFHLYLSSCVHFTPTHFVAIKKPCQGNFGKLEKSGETRFRGSEKDPYFLKITKWQHKLVRDYKRRMLVCYFPNSAGKTCLDGSENIEIEHVVQPIAVFHFSRDLHTSCLSAFKQTCSFKIQVC